MELRTVFDTLLSKPQVTQDKMCIQIHALAGFLCLTKMGQFEIYFLANLKINHHEYRKNNLGVLAGAAAGAVVALLIAPEKGSETRTQIADKGEKMLNSLKSKFEDFLISIISAIADEKQESKKSHQHDKEQKEPMIN